MHPAEAAKTNKNMHDDEHGNDDKLLQHMSDTDMLAEFMDLISQEGISDNKLRKILAYAERVVSEPDWLVRPRWTASLTSQLSLVE